MASTNAGMPASSQSSSTIICQKSLRLRSCTKRSARSRSTMRWQCMSNPRAEQLHASFMTEARRDTTYHFYIGDHALSTVDWIVLRLAQVLFQTSHRPGAPLLVPHTGRQAKTSLASWRNVEDTERGLQRIQQEAMRAKEPGNTGYTG